jgi:fructokinase
MNLARTDASHVIGPLGSIEAGGTNINCAVGLEDGTVLDTVTIPTTTPSDSYAKVLRIFAEFEENHGAIGALGIAHFGPLELDDRSINYGQVLATPKPGWAGADPRAHFQNALQIPVALQTDVNGSAIGERHFGAGRDIENFAYVTVGTGIGVSAFACGKLVHGSSHPEIGHIAIVQDEEIDTYEGCCAFHGNCLEGLASGTAIERRWGIKGQDLPTDHAAWALEAQYLAQLCASLRYFYAPEKIIFGGGVMRREALLESIRTQCEGLIGNYLAAPNGGYDDFIVNTPLRGLAALKGGLVMAANALNQINERKE